MWINSVVKRLKNWAREFKRFFCSSPRCLIKYFVNGLIMMIPLAITIWIVIWLFNLVDGMLNPVLVWGFGRPMRGLGFAIIIFSLVLIGYFGVKVGHKKAFDFIEERFIKIPILGAIYGGTRQILTSFTTSTDSRFLEVVFMEFPRKGIYTIGFVTTEMKDRNGKKVLNVYVPGSPNPTSGFLQIVPESDVIRTSMPISDAMKLIISAGKVSREDIADMVSQMPVLESEAKALQT